MTGDDPDEIASSMTVLAVAGIALAILAMMIGKAEPADVGCLTQEQARKRWPTEHLYWHTRQKCWDNKKKGVMQRTGSPSEHEKRPRSRWGSGAVKFVRPGDYNEIDAQADRDQFFRGQSVAMWPPFLDTWNYVWSRLWGHGGP